MDNTLLMNEAEIIISRWFQENSARMIKVSDAIWELAECKFEEFVSMQTLCNQFQEEGFALKFDLVEGLDTAFVAEWSNGPGPTIAFIGEYDALPGLGHEVAATKIPTGKNGHGCGHNLLGVGSMAAAFAAKRAMEELDISGRLRYFGCPAEEGGAAKVYMVRDGVFDGIDAIVRWHPTNASYVSMSPSLTLYSIKYEYFGQTAHAGVNPHLGRSALDAAIMMDLAVNYLREHIPTDVRVHYVMTKGGVAPNIVPDHAEIWYYIRAPKKADVDHVVGRMELIARGMAMATDTKVKIRVANASSETLPNQVLSNRALKNLLRVGAPRFDNEDEQFAKALNKGLSVQDKARSLQIYGITDASISENNLHYGISPNMMAGTVTPYSTDSGDVSWQAPMCQMFIACQTIGSANHSWQQVVCSGSSIGHKGMLCAGQAIAMTAVDILTDADLLEAAKEEFLKELKGNPYVSPLDPSSRPNED